MDMCTDHDALRIITATLPQGGPGETWYLPGSSTHEAAVWISLGMFEARHRGCATVRLDQETELEITCARPAAP